MELRLLNHNFDARSLHEFIQQLVFLLLGNLGLSYGLQFWFRRFFSDIPLVILNIVRLPILVIIVQILLKLFLLYFTIEPYLNSINRLINASVIIIATYCLVQLVTQIIVQYLKDTAEEKDVLNEYKNLILLVRELMISR